MWNEGIERNVKGLDVATGTILRRCVAKEGATVFTIPEGVEKVVADAFEQHPDLKIIYTPRIAEALTKRIGRALSDVAIDHDNWTKPYVEYAEYGPCMPVFNVESAILESSIKKAVDDQKKHFPDIDWNICTIDADDINSMCETMKEADLVSENGGSVSTLFNLPFIAVNPVRQIRSGLQEVNELISKEGFGILYIKNLNENNNSNFGHNFIYNLTKHHTFNHVRLSPKWLVIIEVGKKVRLDAPGGTRYCYNGAEDWFKNPTEYIKYMNVQGKVVEPEVPKAVVGNNIETEDVSVEDTVHNEVSVDKEETVPEEETVKEQSACTAKEIDWEERYFQICLALIQRPDFSANHGSSLFSVKRIMSQADSMVEALKKHNENI